MACSCIDSTLNRSSLEAQIGPSILNADLSSLGNQCDFLISQGADYLHLDVMDGHFVPNLTFGHPLVSCLRKDLNNRGHQNMQFDMHMMVSDPLRWIEPMASAGGNSYTFHVEALQLDDKKISNCIRHVKEAGMRVGLAVNPNTPVDIVVPHVSEVDLVLVMSVEPGFGGQSFIEHTMDKVRTLRQQFSRLDIEVDGGVNASTIEQCAKAGANMIVSGTGIIRHSDPSAIIKDMRSIVKQNLV